MPLLYELPTKLYLFGMEVSSEKVVNGFLSGKNCSVVADMSFIKLFPLLLSCSIFTILPRSFENVN